MSYAELEREETRIRELKAKRYQEVADTANKANRARQMLAQAAKDLGAPVPTLAAPSNGSKAKTATKAKGKKKLKAGVVRYRDPANHKNIWTGRGPQPGWLAAYTKSGRSLADFAVA